MRLTLVLLLMTLIAPAWAEWVKYGETSKGTDFYYDADSIRKLDSFRFVLEIQDGKKPDKEGVLSRRILNQYDCEKRRFRVLGFYCFSGPMASGEKICTDDRPSKWIPSVAGHRIEKIMQIVCK